MFKQIKTLFLGAMFFALTACGFHFQNGELIPNELKTLTFESSDPYSPMSMAMRKQLQLNNINLVDSAADVATLRINKVTTSDKVASIFKRGREAEKVLILEVEATVKLPNQQSYPISAQVNRTFFDNSRAALAKSAEKEVIRNDMREQAARQLISKMVALQYQVQKSK
ncbi:LPS assembly lipoprotein LptE [Caviibacterium pharyngocola]|uniref:LPS-assembly lipoprotein LptE n=1 Tax=Caviibacterium pharyngocola TaxID=28159 RepID=A0A2M8RVN5_9PAST|nr:LPS assembly lipoprotein LptE [Caviibacterium pharyngocola]PJG82949.1 hypothetical protein CVP04_06190 [Caviibacterium pharyngocola]